MGGAGSISLQNDHFGPLSKFDTIIELQDSIPKFSDHDEDKMNIKDIDQLIHSMEQEMLKMQNEINKIDFEKMQKEIATSLNKIDLDKIKSGIDRR